MQYSVQFLDATKKVLSEGKAEVLERDERVRAWSEGLAASRGHAARA